MSKQTTITTSDHQFPQLWAWAIIAFTFIVYYASLNNGMTNWDDNVYVVENPMMKEGLSSVFTKTVLGNYHPLTMFSLWLNFQMSGLNAKSYHVFNLLLHLANCYLVFKFIWQISDKKKIVAALVTLFFAIHPMHVESVAWVAERKDVLYSFFFLLGLNAYWKYLDNKQSKTLIITFLYFTFSLLSKPAAIVFPVILLLLDYYKGRALTGKIITEKAVFFALSIAFAVFTFSIQIKDQAVRGLGEYTIAERFIFASYDLLMYSIESIVPFQLSPVHPFPKAPYSMIFMLSPLFVLLLLGALYFFRKQKTVVFGMAFYLINLILVLQIITIGQAVMAERYTYLPYIGLFYAFLYPIENEQIKEKTRQMLVGGFGVLALVFSFLTFQQIGVWKDTASMWTAVLNVYPDSEAGLYNRGSYYSGTKGLEASALEDFNKLLLHHPNHVEGITKRGRLYARFSKFEQAFIDFDRAESLTTDKAKLAIIISNRSYTYFYTGNKEKALSEAKRAISYGLQIDAKYMEALTK